MRRNCHPSGYENSLLKDHFVGDECLAFQDPKRAMQVLPAELFSNGQPVPPAPLQPPYTLEALVKCVTAKRLPDQGGTASWPESAFTRLTKSKAPPSCA
jgi:hypothetical protein